MIKIVSDCFKDNWDEGERIKNNKLEEIILENIKEIKKKLQNPSIKKSNLEEDMNYGIDYFLNWDIPIAFRGRRYDYETFSKKGGSFTLRKHGERGGIAEIYKMINKEYKARIYVFVWKCGSYGILDISKWINSGILETKLNISIKNKNGKNDFIPFTLKELKKIRCVIKFHNAKQRTVFDF